MSDFKKAVKWLKEGKKVRRSTWGKKYYYYMKYSSVREHSDGTEINAWFGKTHFEATDWEIYCEEHEWIFEHAEGDSCGHNKMVCEKLRCFMGRCKNCGMEKPKEIELKKRTFPERIAYFKNKFDQGDIDEQSYMIQIEAAVEAFK